MVTIYDIAKKANVSAMTVSRVLNNSGRIRESTRRKVLQAAEELGYVPNSLARGLIKGESRILSLLIPDITNPFFTTLARGAEDAAKAAGYRLLLANSDEDFEKEEQYVDMVLSARVDGVLFAPAGDESAAQLEKLRRRGVPFVLVDRLVPGVVCDAVVGDGREGTFRLIEHLVGLGHRRIAMLNGPRTVSTAREREEAFFEAMRRYGLPVDERFVARAGYRRLSEEEAEAVVRRLFAVPEPPSAILAANNFLAVSAVCALRRFGLSVPDDVSVVCFDDLELSSAVDPFLTVAAQPAYEFGAKGVELLVERIRKAKKGDRTGTDEASWAVDRLDDAPNIVVFPPELVVRRSARPPRGDASSETEYFMP